MSRLVPLVVALLAITAGCTGGPIAPGSTDSTPTDSPSETDAPTTTDEPTDTATPEPLSGALAPGVTADGVENASALVDAHVDALRESGFELDVERSAERDGEAYRTEQRLAVASQFEALRANGTSVIAGNRSVQRNWFDDSMDRMLVRIDAGDRTRYRIPPVALAGSDSREYYARQFVEAHQLEELLRGGEFDVSRANGSDDGPRYRLVGSNFSDDGSYGDREVRLVVDGDGVIHDLEANGTLENGASFTYDYRVERLDVDSVTKPDWVANAPEPIDTRPSASLQNCSSTYLTLENEDPDAVPEGSVVTVTLNGTEYEATLEAPLETGERRALYLDDAGDLRVTDVDSVPADRTAMPKEAEVVVETGDGILLSSGAMGFGCETASEGSSGSDGSESGSASGSSSE